MLLKVLVVMLSVMVMISDMFLGIFRKVFIMLISSSRLIYIVVRWYILWYII